jgi:hypothetical protein
MASKCYEVYESSRVFDKVVIVVGMDYEYMKSRQSTTVIGIQ